MRSTRRQSRCMEKPPNNSEVSVGMSQERKRIVAYLRACADMKLGTVLTPGQREAVGWASAWIENDLDVQWERTIAAQERPRAPFAPRIIR